MPNMKKQLESVFGKIEESKWKESAKEWKANRDWIRYSQKIALAILNHLDHLQWSQKYFAEAMGVSPQAVNKWLKGKENFTLETIARMEKVLGKKLISIPKASENVDFSTERIPAVTFQYNLFNREWGNVNDNFKLAKVISMTASSYSAIHSNYN